MEGKRRLIQRTLGRVHTVSRIEPDLWAFVYELLLPQTVPKLQSKPRPARVRVLSNPSASAPFARGA
jgi:hypothetical protein